MCSIDIQWAISLGVVVLLLAGMCCYAILLARGYLLGNAAIRELLERHPAHNFGLPFCAIAAFAVVVLLNYGTGGDGELEFEAFGLSFTGPAGPVTLWVVCYLALVGSMRIVR